MIWQDLYEKRSTTAEEAVKRIKSGNRIVVGHATGSPERLLKAMVDDSAAYENVEIVHTRASPRSLSGRATRTCSWPSSRARKTG